MMNKSRAYRRMDKQLAIYRTAKYQRARAHLLKMVSVEAPDSMLVVACYRLARIGLGGAVKMLLHTIGVIAELALARTIWYATRAWWFIRYPGRSAESVWQERLDRETNAHNAECDQAGHPEFKV
jgi:hypothetical protein